MIASEPSQREGRQGGPDLGDHPARDDARRDERLRLTDCQRPKSVAVGVADAVDVGQQDELAGTEARGDPGGCVVGVDVADDPVAVAGKWRDDRDLAADEDRIEQVATKPDDRRHETEVRDALGDQEAAVDARQSDRIDAEVAESGDELAVHDAAQDGGGDLEGLGVGHPQAALEPAWHAEALEPFGDPLAAAMDEDHGTSSRDRGHFLEHLATGRRSSSHPA